ncbi:P2Y purinoceptor 3 [Gouania willdenowi]|uniref:P2Y purinoceptor 3-like n=1 Tax=Gouania willdenowi TaxID=441366 RepID=A0A8C5E0D3_GOUWI|nr:P2Y purinoceptor 3-like [Gouania willdenowi]XP_028330450.1 P2Y purinoceptor 3-like [Gouania willdenowi]
MSSNGGFPPNVSLEIFLGNPRASSPLPEASTPQCSIDESYKYIFLPICYSFTFIFSISLNSVILYRSFRQTKRWNASLIYMVNLATTDFMYGLSLPFLVASYIIRDRWVFGDFMCRLVRFLFYFNLYCSIFFLTCISVHRYLGICHPMKVITLESKKAVKSICVLVWIVVFALTCPIFRFAQTGHVTRMAGLGSKESTMTVNLSYQVVSGDDNATSITMGGSIEEYQNCWDDAIDKEFSDYVPYGITLHLLGFFVPFSIIAWCYSHVVLTIFKTLHSQPSTRRVQGDKNHKRHTKRHKNCSVFESTGSTSLSRAVAQEEGISILLGARSPYASRRRKSIKTIITITLLFALCFLPFHVTRTIFLLLKILKGVSCHTMTTVSMCYKITRPLASFNAWLNALLYFLIKDKGGTQCCWPVKTTQEHGGLLLPLRITEKDGWKPEDGNNKNKCSAIPSTTNVKSTNIKHIVE